MKVSMPPRNTTAEVMARAASKCLRLACARHYQIVPLGEIGEVVSGGTPSTGRSEYWDGDILWVTPKDLGKPRTVEVESAERRITKLGLSSSSARLLPAGTVLLSSRAPIGHVGIAARPLATNQGFKNIICSDRLNNRFLFHILRGSVDELTAEGRGNTFLEIPGTVVRNFPIPLPPGHVQESVASFLDALYSRISGQQNELPVLQPPLAEQRWIVARIEELATKITEARTLRQQAFEEAEALSRASGNALFENAAREFGRVKLEEVTSRITKGESPEWQGFSYQDSGPLFIRSENVLWGALYPTSAVRIPEEFHRKLSRSQLQPGDVLINLVGASIGRSCVVPQGLGDANVNQAVAVITPDSGRIVPEFLVRFLLSPSAQETIHGGKVETARPNISLGDLRALQLPLTPISEQRRIVAYLDSLQAKVDALKKFQGETAAELDALLPSILDKAFKGELVT